MKSFKNLAPIVFLLLVFILAFFLLDNSKEKAPSETNTPLPSSVDTLDFNDSDFKISFQHPKSWGEVLSQEANKICPLEDTYRSADTLHVYDREYRFMEEKLPGSDSMIRRGIKLYYLDTEKPNDCGDSFLIPLATKKITGAELSSVRLEPLEFAEFFGVYNQSASRLNTEGRAQYTLFTKDTEGSRILIVQPYVSFIPYFGSPELLEMEQEFAGDMESYIKGGRTAAPIRDALEELHELADSITKIPD